MKKNYFIQETGIKKHKGALHRQLGIAEGKKIPTKLLGDIQKAKLGEHVKGHKVTLLLKKRATLAKTLRRY